MSIITATDACKIGVKHKEAEQEEAFALIMRVIAAWAKDNQCVDFADYNRGCGEVRIDKTVQFLIDNPSQVKRLENMGYTVKREDTSEEVSWEENENYETSWLYFGTQLKSRTIKKDKVVTLRKLIISWECGECDGE